MAECRGCGMVFDPPLVPECVPSASAAGKWDRVLCPDRCLPLHMAVHGAWEEQERKLADG